MTAQDYSMLVTLELLVANLSGIMIGKGRGVAGLLLFLGVNVLDFIVYCHLQG